jgi:tetratricopeptide (TPR) repeat protein
MYDMHDQGDTHMAPFAAVKRDSQLLAYLVVGLALVVVAWHVATPRDVVVAVLSASVVTVPARRLKARRRGGGDTADGADRGSRADRRGVRGGTTPRAVGDYERGYERFTRGEYDASIDFFRTAIDRDPNDADAHFYLGLALAAQARHAEAVPLLRCAVGLRPLHTEAHYRLGVSLAAAGQHAAAATALREALRLDPAARPVRAALDEALRRSERAA